MNDKEIRKPFGYAIQADNGNGYETHSIFPDIHDAGVEAGCLAMQGYEVRIKNLETPLDWIIEESNFEPGDQDWQNQVIANIAKMIAEESATKSQKTVD